MPRPTFKNDSLFSKKRLAVTLGKVTLFCGFGEQIKTAALSGGIKSYLIKNSKYY